MNKRYPVGKFHFDDSSTFDDVSQWINTIKNLPAKLAAELDGVSDEILDTPYREDGWTVRQVVHHICDSHMNALIRVRLALTEDNPTIKPYDEAAWAEMADYSAVSVTDALTFIRILHAKWVAILDSMTEEDFSKTFFHPEGNINYSLIKATAMYAWHSDHHLAHIQLVTQQ